MFSALRYPGEQLLHVLKSVAAPCASLRMLPYSSLAMYSAPCTKRKQLLHLLTEGNYPALLHVLQEISCSMYPALFFF